MEKLVTSNLRLGILGGGQLGRMLALAAGNWNIHVRILDKERDMPAGLICRDFVEGDFRDLKTVLDFGEECDVVTVENEQVNVQALKELRDRGKMIFPEPEILEMIQDKFLQNNWFSKNAFPKKPYRDFASAQEVLDALANRVLAFPFVQKSRCFGYDGKGVRAFRGAGDLDQLLDCPSIVEDWVEIEKEISVIVARNSRGEIAVYDPVEMVFNKSGNLLDYLVSPADLTSTIKAEAQQIAVRIIERLSMTGLLAVEMFLSRNQNLWVNEMAPRPHNSGHHTIEGCITSQYEQHLRAIFGLPLGSTRIKMPSLMVNLLGEEGADGPARYEGLTECMALEGVKIHLYGKTETKPLRKMGHVTILDSNKESAMKKLQIVKSKLKVKV